MVYIYSVRITVEKGFSRVNIYYSYPVCSITNNDDFEALLKRRVYDMAGTVKGIKIFLNGTRIKLDFKKYIEIYARAINRERGLQEGAESR